MSTFCSLPKCSWSWTPSRPSRNCLLHSATIWWLIMFSLHMDISCLWMSAVETFCTVRKRITTCASHLDICYGTFIISSLTIQQNSTKFLQCYLRSLSYISPAMFVLRHLRWMVVLQDFAFINRTGENLTALSMANMPGGWKHPISDCAITLSQVEPSVDARYYGENDYSVC